MSAMQNSGEAMMQLHEGNLLIARAIAKHTRALFGRWFPATIEVSPEAPSLGSASFQQLEPGLASESALMALHIAGR